MSKLHHALSLAAQGFWVFPIVAGKKSPPAVKGWQAWATRDTAKIGEHWGRNPDDNIGISTSKFHDDQALLVVDVDNKGNKRGSDEIIRLELTGCELPDTHRVDTPTGGQHLFFCVPRAVRQGTDVIGTGLDVRSSGGYVVASGSDIAGREYIAAGDQPVHAAPAWLVERCGVQVRPARERNSEERIEVEVGRALARSIGFASGQAPLAAQGAAGDQATFKVAAKIKDYGVDEDTCYAVLSEHWNPRCSPPWSEEDLRAKVRNAYAYGQDAVGSAAPEADFKPIILRGETSEDNLGLPQDPGHPFARMNKDFAFVIAGGGAHILWETTDAEENETLEHLSVSAFHQKFAADKIQYGKRTEPVTDGWMEWKQRRSYDGMVFMPCLEAPSRFYNLWRGFAFEPWPANEPVTADAQWALDAWREHVEQNICNGKADLTAWLLSYFAHLIQRPWEKPLVALVFKGEKGVGKNAAIERVGALLGGHSMTTADRRYLVGNFNGHLENCLLFVLDEAFWSGDKQAEGIIKNLVTGQHHVIEHKGKEQFKVANRTRVAIIGNEDWLVPASHDERRFAVFDVGAGRKQDTQFFEQMRVKMERGGYRLLLRYLKDPELLTANVNVAPVTAALLEQKVSSLEPLHQWWLACLSEGRIVSGDFGGDWPSEVESERFQLAFQRYFKGRNIKNRSPDPRVIGKQLRQACPAVKHTKHSRDIGYVYRFPSLAECRAAWELHIGHETEWSE
jgi:hypothetical protein